MENNEKTNQTEDVLIRQLSLIEKQIADLTQEKIALQRLLIKIRQGDADLRDVSRKNSVERILIEKRIIERLAASKRSVSAAELYKAAKEIKTDLNDNTFRSYLKRLGDRRLIENGRTRGHWALPQIKLPPDIL